jgi:hypothetical protein
MELDFLAPENVLLLKRWGTGAKTGLLSENQRLS